MNKKIIYLVFAIIILAALIAIYATGKNEPTEDNNNTDTNAKIELKKSDNVSQIEIKNQNGNYVITLNDDKYAVTGYENNSVSQSALKQIFNFVSDLSAEQLVEQNASDLSKYGLDKPTATANVKSDSPFTFDIGNVTADNKYRYVRLDNSNDVYLMNKNTADTINISIKDLIDKTISTIQADSINYVNIKQNNKPEILITSDEDNKILQNYVSTSGLSALIMQKPIENAIVYPTNMREFLLSDLPEMTINDIAELNSNNLSKYGLDKPNMEIVLKDSSNKSITFKTGNSDTNNNLYVLIDSRPEIYVMNKNNFNAFENANIMDFIQNFVSLHARSTVDNITIVSDSFNHKIELKTEGDNKIAVDSEGVKRDNRNDYIDSKLIAKDVFGDFYEQLSGISFDSIEYNTDKKADKAALTITYNLSDGSNDTTEYFDYNDNFYFIKKENNILFVNKQQITQLINKINELCK